MFEGNALTVIICIYLVEKKATVMSDQPSRRVKHLFLLHLTSNVIQLNVSTSLFESVYNTLTNILYVLVAIGYCKTEITC
uniref:Uncharacterized protein n=1 Tax=Anguilla anguilla TaxID=7936 RepID=A0A0E9X2U7_ANGAN